MKKPCLSALLVVANLYFMPLASAETPRTAQVLAVKFYADWCSSCQELSAPLAELKQEFKNDAVLFLTLDFTDQRTTRQAEMLANAIGIGPIVKDNVGTGFVLLVNRDGSVQRLTTANSYTEMSQTLRNALDDTES